jgi:hypothetical protein
VVNIKAYDIFMFLLMINVGIYIVDELGVFGHGVGGGFISFPLALTIMAIASLIGAAGAKYLGTQITSIQGAAIFAFGTIFWATLGNTMDILNNIHVPSVLLLGMGTIHGFIFAAAAIQMATGGWRSAK